MKWPRCPSRSFMTCSCSLILSPALTPSLNSDPQASLLFRPVSVWWLLQCLIPQPDSTTAKHGCCSVTKSHLTLCDPIWTVARQASLSMGIFRQEYRNSFPFPFPSDISGPGIESVYPALADGFFTTEPPGKPLPKLLLQLTLFLSPLLEWPFQWDLQWPH